MNKDNKWFIKILIILFMVALFAVGFYFGKNSLLEKEAGIEDGSSTITPATFTCDEDKSIQSLFYDNKVTLNLSDGRTMNLMSTISASGARYSNWNDSFVFWNKGNTAFIMEGDETTFVNCVQETEEQ